MASSSASRCSRRSFLRRCGLAAGGLALNGCAPRLTSSAAPSQARLVYQDWRTEWFPPMAQEMLARFHAEHPGIGVFYTLDPPSDDFNEQMLSDFEAGTAPDLFQGCCSFLPAWAQKGYILPLDPFLSDLPAAWQADWDPAQLSALKLPSGSRFALPKYHGALALFFNKDLFDRSKVDYPDESWNHNDYLAAMRALTLDLDGDGLPEQFGSMAAIAWDRIQVRLNAWGGHIVDPDHPALPAFARPEALAAAEWLRARIWDDRVMASPLDVQKRTLAQVFISGQAAMIEEGSWSLKEILSKARFRAGVAPLPKGPARRVTLAGTDGFSIFAGTLYREAAWDLLKFLSGVEYSRAMMHANLLQPSRLSLLQEWIVEARNQFDAAAQMDLEVFARGQAQGYSVVAEVFSKQELAEPLLNDAWLHIFTLGDANVEILKGVSAKIEAALKA